MFLFIGSMLFDYGLKALMGPERNTDPKAALQQATPLIEGGSSTPFTSNEGGEHLDESYAYTSSQNEPQSGVRITDQQTGEEITTTKRRRTA